MTLVEWSQLSGEQPTHHESGATSVHVPRVNEHRVALWSLSDYAVSSVVGPTVYLVPKMTLIHWTHIDAIRDSFASGHWKECRAKIDEVRDALNSGARLPNDWTRGAVHERLNYFETRIPEGE